LDLGQLIWKKRFPPNVSEKKKKWGSFSPFKIVRFRETHTFMAVPLGKWRELPQKDNVVKRLHLARFDGKKTGLLFIVMVPAEDSV